jgi:transposase
MVKVHSMIVGDTTRVKNRIKALYRSRGVNVAQKSVYSKKGRKAWLEKLPESSRAAIGHLYAQYDQLEEVRNQAQKELVTESHRHPISEILETCPGVGEIRAAQIIATVMVPERFRTRQQFWAYCGLGIVMRSSSDWIQTADGRWTRAQVQHTRGLNMSRNAMLKTVFKGAATSVLQQHRSSVLYADYARMVEAGTKPNLAKVTLARKIAATVLAMWKKKEAYDPAKRTSKTS